MAPIEARALVFVLVFDELLLRDGCLDELGVLDLGPLLDESVKEGAVRLLANAGHLCDIVEGDVAADNSQNTKDEERQW